MLNRPYSLTLALALAALTAACSDDEDPGTPIVMDGSSITTAPPDARISDAAVPADAGVSMDAMVLGDAAVRPPAIDGAVARDGGPATRDAAPVANVVNDAGQSAPDAAAPLSKSTACLACEKKRCNYAPQPPDFAGLDYNLLCSMTKDAEGKPIPGGEELCNKVKDCVRQSGCAHPDYLGCLCGDLTIEQCQVFDDTKSVYELPGACRMEIIAAAQTMELDEILGVLSDQGSPVGAALKLMECVDAKCANECFAPCAGKPNGATCDTGWDGTMQAPTRMCAMSSCPDDFFDSDIYLPVP